VSHLGLPHSLDTADHPRERGPIHAGRGCRVLAHFGGKERVTRAPRSEDHSHPGADSLPVNDQEEQLVREELREQLGDVGAAAAAGSRSSRGSSTR